MVNYSGKWKYYSNKKCGNGDKELDFEVEGEKTRELGSNFCGYK